MTTVRYSCGFYIIARDGEDVANTGDACVARAEAKTGLRVNGSTIRPLDVVAAMVGPDAVEAVAAHYASLPKPRVLTERQKRAQYARELKGR